MRRLLFLIIICTTNDIVNSQRIDSLELFLIESRRVAFVTPDSTYKFTQFITQDGKFYFVAGFVDSMNNYLFFRSSDLIKKNGEI